MKQKKLGRVKLTLIISLIVLLTFGATLANGNLSINDKTIQSASEVLDKLDIDGEHVFEKVEQFEQALGVQPEEASNDTTISMLDSINKSLKSEKSEKEYQLTKSPEGNYELVVVERIPLTDKDNTEDLDEYVNKSSMISLNEEEQNDEQTQNEAPDNNSEIGKLEKEMLELVNEERASRDLQPLKWDNKLAKTAEMKCLDIIENDYFGHQSPTYGSPFDLMKSQGVKYMWAGENLAGAPKLEVAHRNLMNSEGHRKNILHPEFTHIGIGIVEGSKYQIVFTQHFISY